MCEILRLTVCGQGGLPVVTIWVTDGQRCGEEKETDLGEHYDRMF